MAPKRLGEATTAVKDSEPTEPKSQLDLPLPHLEPVYSTSSTIDDALDAEANYAPGPPTTATDPEKENDPGPPPNGGSRAWLQVAGSFFLFFNCWYVPYSINCKATRQLWTLL